MEKVEKEYQSVAGLFFPKEKEKQEKIIQKFLERIPQQKIIGQLKALIVPHAAWEYSGKVAVTAFSLLQNYCFLKKLKKAKAVLLGPSHLFWFSGVQKGIIDHSVEVEIPFIKYFLPQAKITPLVYGQINYKNLAERVLSKLDKDSFLIVSSDFSHYYPAALAEKIDKKNCRLIENLNLEGFIEEGEACGKLGICTLLFLAKTFNWQPLLLEYKNSGEVSGLKEKVVGYASFAFFLK